MVKKIVLPLCVAVLLAVFGSSCHREPVEPTPSSDSGEITDQPIVENGEEVGYALSYRSWIVPGEGSSGNKAQSSPKSIYNDNSSAGREPNANSSKSFESRSNASETKSLSYGAKGGSSTQNDTVSVILHDKFYHVDTIAYVSDWNPDKYKQGSYTCHWDRYGLPRPGESNVTIIDSTAILRVQFAEFSFNYCLNFEVANYNDGVINIQMPYHAPVVTDLGVEELESLETICRNDSVFARKVLKHSIKVVVGDKIYILNAKVLLYWDISSVYNPSRFVVRSEYVEPLTVTFVPTDSLGSTPAQEVYTGKILQYWSDGTTETYNLNLKVSLTCTGVHNETMTFPFDYDNPPAFSAPNIVYDPESYYIYFNYDNGITVDMICNLRNPSISGTECNFTLERGIAFEDGYTGIYNAYRIKMKYLRTEYVFDGVQARLKTYVRFSYLDKDYPPQEFFTELISY